MEEKGLSHKLAFMIDANDCTDKVMLVEDV